MSNRDESESMPELADQLDEALSQLRNGNSEAIEQLIAESGSDEEALSECRSSAGSIARVITAAAEQMKNRASLEAYPCIPNFEIVGELGRGGMGVVYEAIQLHPRRRVAIKLMRPGRESDAYHRMLFDREILALASLEHANIASIYHASTIEGGRAYFVMELAQGIPINEFADRNKLDVQARLQLFCQVCDGVHHAHLRGVIHRDLKPSNVLAMPSSESGSSASAFGSAARIKIMDFGLARLMDSDPAAEALRSQTIDADRIKGTIAFMSPEQLRGENSDIDGRSDVYALGVMLFQLLTGRLPLDPAGKSLPEFIRDAAQRSPPRLGSIRPALRGDLEVITQTALSTEKSKRYQSASQLADDIRRYLRREPIFARPSTAIYHFRLFAKRNRALVFGSCAVLLALLAGFVATSIALVHANAAQQETAKAHQTADQINEFLNQMLATADPNVTRGRDLTVVAMLDEASRKLDEGALSGQDTAEANVRMTMADAYLSLGLYPQAQTQYEIVVRKRQDLMGKMHREVADALLKLAFVMTRQEQFDAAHASVDEAIRIRTALDGERSLPLAKALAARAEIWIRMSRNEDARAILCDLLPKMIALTGSEDNEDVALIKGRLGFCHGCNDSVDEGIRLLDEALATERRLFGPNHERLARTLINLGALHRDKREQQLAESLTDEALAIRRRVYGDDHPATATARFNLAACYFSQGRFDEAESAFRHTLAVQERRLVPGHYEIGRTRHYLAVTLLRLNRCEEAEPEFRRTIDELQDQPSVHQAGRASNAQAELAECLASQGRFAEAERELLEAVQRFEQLNGTSTAIRRYGSRFVKLYESWGKASELAAWRNRVDESKRPAESIASPSGSKSH
jgi:eukaryotic-like serine/threonine-protein kinase